MVSRDDGVTRAWAKEIFRQGKWMGIRWWSYYDFRWGSIGLRAHNAIRPRVHLYASHLWK